MVRVREANRPEGSLGIWLLDARLIVIDSIVSLKPRRPIIIHYTLPCEDDWINES